MRKSASARGYGARWRAFRLRFLAANPLCARCFKRGEVAAATVVDHIVPHRGDPELFWREGNHQSLCEPCHNRDKQAEEVRGYDDAVGLDGWPCDPRHPTLRAMR